MDTINKSLLYNLLLLTLLISCRKFVEIKSPPNAITRSNVFQDNSTAVSALTSIYSKMLESSGNLSSGSQSISLITGLSADELFNYSIIGDQSQFYNNGLLATNNTVQSVWSELYRYIYTSNSIIEDLMISNGVSNSVKQQLIGEAKFIRAFCHFYLVNLFGDIPLVTTTDYRVNSAMPRTPQSKVYQQIIKDLEDAKFQLSDNYILGINVTSSERVRPNKWVACALLSRVYLYLGDWVNAEIQATAILNNSSLYSLAIDLNDVFLKNSKETIWQMIPIVPGFNTFEGMNLILYNNPSTGSANNVSIRGELLNAFEINDKRRINWIKDTSFVSQLYSYPFKYKVKGGASGLPITEYLCVFRLSEQYLIRAEARAQQNNITGSKDDLNIIRNRAGLANSSVNDKNALLMAIEHERQVELFAEWGHRWFDLRRIGKIDALFSTLKVGNWQPTDILFPIPQFEILNGVNLVQNLGY
jgi:hypothetical protein